MTVTNTTSVKSFSQFLRYMSEVESHNGIDPRYVISATRGPISLGSARADFRKLMSGRDRDVDAIATLHSAAPGEMDKIARQLEKEDPTQYPAGSLEPLDAPVIGRYMDMVLEAEERSAPCTAGIYVGQIDGESGLFHVHGMRLNIMLEDVEVRVTRKLTEKDANGKPVLDDEGKPVYRLNKAGKPFRDIQVEKVSKGQALPPSMRDTLRARKSVDTIWLKHGIDNMQIVSPGKNRTYLDRARDYLRQLEANRRAAMTPDEVLNRIIIDGHTGSMVRGKKTPRLTLNFKDGDSFHRIRTHQLDVPGEDAPSLAWDEFTARMAIPPAPAVEKIIEPVIDSEKQVLGTAYVAAEHKNAAEKDTLNTLEDVAPTPAQVTRVEKTLMSTPARAEDDEDTETIVYLPRSTPYLEDDEDDDWVADARELFEVNIRVYTDQLDSAFNPDAKALGRYKLSTIKQKQADVEKPLTEGNEEEARKAYVEYLETMRELNDIAKEEKWIDEHRRQRLAAKQQEKTRTQQVVEQSHEQAMMDDVAKDRVKKVSTSQTPSPEPEYVSRLKGWEDHYREQAKQRENETEEERKRPSMAD